MQSFRFAYLALTLCCLASLPAQKTWLVDAANGVGTDFTDLPAALAAAKDGDTLRIRKGSYTPGKTGKALTLLAEDGAVVQNPIAQTPFVIEGLPAGRTFTIVGLGFVTGTGLLGSEPSLEITSCQGRVHLDGVAVLSQVHYSVQVDTAAMVTVSNCYFQQAFYAQSTRLYAQRTVFDSHSYMSGPPSMGLYLYKSYAELSQCTAKGSDNIGHAPSLSAVVCAETVLVLRGTSASRYIGGNYANQFQSPAIDGKGSSQLHHDPAIGFTGSLTGLTRTTQVRLPALTGSGGTLGTAVTTDLYSPSGDTWLLYLALPSYPLLFEPFGEFALDLGTLIFVGGGLQGPTGHNQVGVPVPNDPGLRGLPIAFQAMSGPGLDLRYSNPSITVLR